MLTTPTVNRHLARCSPTPAGRPAVYASIDGVSGRWACTLSSLTFVALVAHTRSHIKFAWHDLIDIAPDPLLARLDRSDEWMADLLKMPGGMFVFGIVTTADMPTDEAHP